MAVVLSASLFTTNVNAQIILSGGLEVALPMGDWADVNPLGFGASIGAEYPLNDNISADVQVGYIFLTVDDELSDFIASSSMIPAQAGVRYYIDEVGTGLYVKGLVGIHAASTKTEDFTFLGVTVEGETATETNLSFGAGAGFILNDVIDLSLRFNIISTDVDGGDASNYLGFRAAYNFGGE